MQQPCQFSRDPAAGQRPQRLGESSVASVGQSQWRKCLEEIFVFDDTGKYSGYNIILSLIHNKLSTTGGKKCIEKSRKEMPQIANSDDPGCQGYERLFAYLELVFGKHHGLHKQQPVLKAMFSKNVPVPVLE